MDNNRQTRVRYFSLLRAVSCIAIVVYHSFYCAYLVFQPEETAAVSSLTIRNAMTFAVPCFVMVTGALLLDPEKKIPFSHIFKQYLLRAVLALVVFTFLFSLFDFVEGGIEGGADVLLNDYLTDLYTNGSWLHMWYLYLLIGLYLMLPLYRILIQDLSEKLFKYLLVLYTIFQAIIPMLKTVFGLQIGFYIAVYTVYPLYFFLGYALRKKTVTYPLWLSWGLLIISTAAILLLTGIGIRTRNKGIASFCSNYACLPALLQSTSLFTLLQRTEHQPDSFLTRLLVQLDRCCFGIYLVHVLVIYTIYRAFGFNPYEKGLWMIWVCAGAVLLVSWGFVWVLRKIPAVRKVL